MNAADFQPALDWLNQNPNWLLFSIFLISFIESLALAGIIVPGVLMLFLVAGVAGHLDFAISPMLIAGFLGAVLGDGISFYLGRYFKDSIPRCWPFSRYPQTLQMGQNFFQRHGGKSIMIGRFIGPVRPVVPLVAGMLGMSHLRFSAFNVSSAVIWAPFYLLPGYLAGKASSWYLPDNTMPIILSLIGLILVFSWCFRYLSQRLQTNGALYNALFSREKPLAFFKGIHQHIDLINQKHPKFEFPLASLGLLLVSSMFFISWSILVTQTQALQPLDQLFLNWTEAVRNDPGIVSKIVTHSSLLLTLLGDEIFLYISFIVLITLMLARQHYYATLHIIVAGLLIALLTHALKTWFGVERPDITLAPPVSLAYPSGHSSGATVFYALIASFAAQEMSPRSRWKCYLSFAIPIVLIALSRVLLGVHWFSDILGGISLGLIIVSLARISYSYFYLADSRQAQEAWKDRLLIGLFGLIWLVSAVLYQLWAVESSLFAIQLQD